MSRQAAQLLFKTADIQEVVEDFSRSIGAEFGTKLF
jgi:hypothetical protein